MSNEQQTLMALFANKLLDKFGAGSHKPGSGSAAALMGVLAGKLIITVAKNTGSKAVRGVWSSKST